MQRIIAWLTLLAGVITVATFTAASFARVPLPPQPLPGPTWAPPAGVTPHPQADLCKRSDLKCPDLAMRRPYQISGGQYEGYPVLYAANAILSLGPGPLEITGKRSGTRSTSMPATQRIYKSGGGFVRVRNAGELGWKRIPGQNGYWKYKNAAKFELWTADEPSRLVKVGEKLIYCFRDLRRAMPELGGPKKAVYPACSQDRKAKWAKLGNSVGWADIYPATYYEQYIELSGLAAGCYKLWQIADPENSLVEVSEENNASFVRVQLPVKDGERPASC